MSVSENSSPPVILFDCPSCGGGLGIPENLLGIEGPCPFCRADILAPDPKQGLEAQLSKSETTWNPWNEFASQPAEDLDSWNDATDDPPDLEFPAPPPSFDRDDPHPPLPEVDRSDQYTSPIPTASAPDAEAECPSLSCGSCGISLDIDPHSDLTGGPCPACNVWIDLSGRPQVETAFIPDLRRPPSSDPTQRIPLPKPPFRETDRVPPIQKAPSEQPDSLLTQGERRVRKTTKRRRVLPEECYVGTAAQHRPSPESRTSHSPRPSGGKRAPLGADPDLSRKLIKTGTIFVALAIPIAVGLAIAFHFHLIQPGSFSFLKEERVVHPQLEAAVLQANSEMENHRDETLERASALVHEFLESPHWGRQELLLLTDLIPENEPVIAALRVFPCEDYADGTLEILSTERIPLTERFIVNFRLTAASSELPPIHFVTEEMKNGDIKIHALHLYQCWKSSLIYFLESPGAPKGRFYAHVALAAELPGEHTSFRLPQDANYRKLRLKDSFNRNIWRTNAFVRTEGTGATKTPSWAAYVLLNKLNEMDWSRAVLDLEWRQGPDGDFFIEITGVQGCNWGDFPR